MSITKRNALLSLAVAGTVTTFGSAARAELTFYEDFNYTSGAALHNQHNISGTTDDVWTRAGTVAAGNITIGAGSLTSPVDDSSGNKATITNPATASTERLNFTPYTSGSVFYSMTINATVGIASVNNTSGAYFCGLSSFGDNGDVDSGAPPAIVNTSARLAFRTDPLDSSKLNLGLTNTLAQNSGNYASAQITQGTDVFVIVGYDINAGAADDVSNLWINPNLATFDPTTTPADKTVSNATPIITSDMVQASSFFLRQTGGLPESVNIDEIRLGTSHYDVTPQKYYWDINGTTPDSGGTAPDGAWDGVENYFNTDSAGGSGHFTADPHAWDSVVFSAGSDASGSFTVSVSGSRSVAAVKVEEGHVTLTGGSLSTKSFDIASGATATVTSDLSSPTGLMDKSGDGTLQVARLPQNNAMHIDAGTVQVLDSAPTFPSHPAGSDASVSQPSGLGISPGATLDLGNNDMIIAYGTGTPYNGFNPTTMFEALIAQGFNGGDWLGTGITSSAAASVDAAGNFVLGIVDNASLPQPYGVSNGGDNFDGIDVPVEAVLVKFTHRADLNLDGLVTDADAIIFSTNYEVGAPATWSLGDLDYNGVFSDNDAIIFGTYYDTGLAHLPEPASLAALGLLGVGLARRCRRA